jgi:hypothetical protein
MNNVPTEIGRAQAPAKSGWLGVVVIVVLFALPFTGFGVFALASGIKEIVVGPNKDGATACVFGFIFTSIGLGLVAAVLWGRKKMNQEAVLKARFPDRPWMVRPDWAGGKIKPAYTAPVGVYLLWSCLALAITTPMLFQIPQALHTGQSGIFMLLIFPLAAGGLLTYSFVLWRQHRRFGDCFFEPAQTPTPLGGVLEGMIQTGKPLPLEHPLRLTCTCTRRVVTGSGKERHTSETPLWQEEKVYRADASLPQLGPDHTGIPIHFKLPDDQPECYSQRDESIYWRLEARTKGFHIAFDVPVYKVAGAAVAEADDPDPTAPLQARMEDVRRDEHSRIQISDGPHGREFYFPPARNVGSCFVVTLMTILFSGIVVVTWRAHAPIIFPIAFGGFSLLLVVFTFNAWFKSSRVTIDSSGVQAASHWLLLRRSRQFTAGEVERFDLSCGTTSGTRTFWNIKLIKRGAATGGVTMASDIADRAEAEWIAGEMNKALGRR